jgi:glyoxylase-like metal-dependent hydrolase (beta-lactamase superfamily II)
MNLRIALGLSIAALALSTADAQKRADPVKSVRLYVFDCGMIRGLDPSLFQFKKEDLASADMVVTCWLVAHPKGTLMWDVGVIPDTAFKSDGKPVSQPLLMATTTITKPLLPQLAALGYTPSDITYVAFSHYHGDHVANANAFASSTWLVHQEERDAMFAAPPENQAAYDKLKNSKTVTLTKADYDVFGDGSVLIKAAPGHTPGHQVLFVKLPKTGPVLVAGDLWHYPEERTTGKVPNIEFSKEQTAASRASIEAFLKQSKAQLWIEHDIPTIKKLKMAPAYYD